MDTWNDRDDYETSALESRDLFEQMQRTWTWPAPRNEPFQRMGDQHISTLGLPSDPTDPTRDADGLTPLERAALEMQMADSAAARATREWIALLPEPIGTGKACTQCGNAEWSIEEEGYVRWTSVTEVDEDGTMFATTNGWEDMSDSGSGSAEWLTCDVCGTHHAMPENVEWN